MEISFEFIYEDKDNKKINDTYTYSGALSANGNPWWSMMQNLYMIIATSHALYTIKNVIKWDYHENVTRMHQ